MKSLSISDPRDTQIVYVHPRQGFTIKLSLPKKIDGSKHEGCWIIKKTDSDFFSQTRHVAGEYEQEINFVQIYDLKKWTNHSNVFLGSIKLVWAGDEVNSYHNPNTYIEVLVILEAKDATGRDTITVINPVGVSIPVMAHQTLEVVLYNKSDSYARTEPALFFETLKQCTLNYELTLKRNTIHSFDAKSMSFSVLSGDNLVNRSVIGLKKNPALKNPPVDIDNLFWTNVVYRAYHYYFEVSSSQIKQIYGMKNGIYTGPLIEFHNPSSSSHAQDYSVSLSVAVVGKFKKKLDRVFHSAAPLNAPKKVKQIEAIKPSSTDYEKTCSRLLNPKPQDTYEFMQGSEKNITIEIVPPNMLNPKLSDGAVWEMEIKPIRRMYGDDQHLDIRRLEFSKLDHHTGGVQRFSVGISKGVMLSSNTNTLLLGLIQLTCADDPALSRSIICLLVSDRTVLKVSRAIPASDFAMRHHGRSSRSRTIHPPIYPTHFNVKVIPVNEDMEIGCEVSVYEEIKSIPTSSSIDNNARKSSKKKVDDLDVDRRGWGPPSGPFL